MFPECWLCLAHSGGTVAMTATRPGWCWQSLKAFVLLTMFYSAWAALCELVSVLWQICSWVVKFQLGEFAIVRWEPVGSFLFGSAVMQSEQPDGLRASRIPWCSWQCSFNVLAYIYFFFMFCFTSMSRLFLPFKAWHLREPSDCNLGNAGIARTFCTISFKQKQTQKTNGFLRTTRSSWLFSH